MIVGGWLSIAAQKEKGKRCRNMTAVPLAKAHVLITYGKQHSCGGSSCISVTKTVGPSMHGYRWRLAIWQLLLQCLPARCFLAA